MNELITAALIQADIDGDTDAVRDLLKLSADLAGKGGDSGQPASETFR